MRILILGGYGTFGGRLAQLLADEQRLILIIAGRSAKKAKDFCDALPARAQKIPLTFDRDGDVEVQIREINPDLVVDATGPFQSYGEDPYRVVKACITNGIDYMDLADGSEFVKGIYQWDQQAKANNIYVLSGVSSFPVLTAAVVRRLSINLDRIHTIKGGIAPSPYAGVGLNVIRAIASYSGKRLPLTRDGGQSYGYALIETMRYTVSPPGYIPLGNILFSLVDVPDLQVLPEHWPELDSIWLGAGPVPEILHRMLIGLSWLVRMKMLPSLSPFAPLFHFVINILRWGEHRGGMFVSVEGMDNHGKKVERSWHLLAERNDGPLIPSMAIEAIVRRSLAGKRPPAGARPATQELELEDYESIFSRRTIYTGQRDSSDEEEAALYQQILGPALKKLPPPLIKMHNFKKSHKAEGLAQIETGKNIFSSLVIALFGFPKPGKDVPVQISFQQRDGGEIWQRTFAGRSFPSFQWEGKGRSDKLLCERVGPFTFAWALVVEPEKLRLVLRRWSIFGIPLPFFLSPKGECYEYVEEDRFCFNVEINHLLTGLIVHYRGWLVPNT